MENDPKQNSRENTLAVALVALVSGIVLFFLWLISFGIVGNVLMGFGMLMIIGSLHYLLWGRALSAEAAAEREALRRQEARPTLPRVAANAIQDLGRTQGIQEK